jgi:hypothetical protein
MHDRGQEVRQHENNIRYQAQTVDRQGAGTLVDGVCRSPSSWLPQAARLSLVDRSRRPIERSNRIPAHWTKTRCLAPATAGRRRGCSLSSLTQAGLRLHKRGERGDELAPRSARVDFRSAAQMSSDAGTTQGHCSKSSRPRVGSLSPDLCNASANRSRSRAPMMGGCDRVNKPTWVANIVCCRR